jgi:hypothetical protein
MEPDLVSGVSACVGWNRLGRSRSLIIWTVFTAAVLVLRLGSRGDRVLVGALWLALGLLPMERYVHSLAAFMARVVLPRYALLSIVALVWSWATCRFRGGGGPFHIVRLGTWRGYPFPFEEWWFILNPSPRSIREFHWLGLAGDVLIPAVVFVVVLRWLQRSGAPVDKTRTLLLAGFTVIFVWLNVDFLIGGLPLSWIGSQPDTRFLGEACRGFPFPYEGLPSFGEWQWSAVAINVAIGLTAWAGLYSARRLARAIQSRLT